MPQTTTVPSAAPEVPDAPSFGFERLDCYRLAVEFQGLGAELCGLDRIGALRNQLDRASVSIVLNIAEGAGRRTPSEQAHFFVMARGSATECAAVLDLLTARGLLTESHRCEARTLLVRIVQILTRLIARQAA